MIIRGARKPRRDSIAIMADILNVLVHGGPMRKTKLMNLANLNTKSFEQHVEGILIARGLIENLSNGNGRNEYAATSNGARFLQIVALLEEILRVEQTVIDTAISVRRQLFARLREKYDIVLGGRVTGRLGIQYHHDMIAHRERTVAGVVDVATKISVESMLLYSMFILASCLDTRIPHFLIVPDEYISMIKGLLEDGCPLLIVEGYTTAERVAERLCSEEAPGKGSI